MFFDYDSFFNWDRPSYSFSRAVHDMYPFKLKTLKDRVVLVHNIVGIKEDDIKVEVKTTVDGRDKLIISGVTHNDVLDYDYKINSSFDFKADDFKSITYEVKDGLLYVNLFLKEPTRTQLTVTKA